MAINTSAHTTQQRTLRTEVRKLIAHNYGWRDLLIAIGEVAAEENETGGYSAEASAMLAQINASMYCLAWQDTAGPIEWTYSQLDDR